MRKLFVYHLEVIIPEAYLQPGWEPQNWDHKDYYGVDEPFTWPRRRNYLSEKPAREQADRLRDYGAFVSVHKSKPVEFVEFDECREDIEITPDHVEYSKRTLVRIFEDDQELAVQQSSGDLPSKIEGTHLGNGSNVEELSVF